MSLTPSSATDDRGNRLWLLAYLGIALLVVLTFYRGASCRTRSTCAGRRSRGVNRLAQPDPGRHLGISRARGADDLRGADVRHRPGDEVAPGAVPSTGRGRCRDARHRPQPGDHRMAGARREGRVVLRIRALDHRHLGNGCQERRPETPACLRRHRDGLGLVVDRLPGQRRGRRARRLSAVCRVAHSGACLSISFRGRVGS